MLHLVIKMLESDPDLAREMRSEFQFLDYNRNILLVTGHRLKVSEADSRVYALDCVHLQKIS